MSGFARRENFGGLWVKGVKAFLKIYCADWRELDDIKLTFLLDLNILPLKTDELISSFNYAGVLDYNGVAYKWKETPEDPLTKKAKEAYDRVIRGQILKIKKKEPEKLTPEEESKKAGEMTLYQETKARLAKEKPLTENEEIALGDRKLYKYYTDNCKEDNEEPLTYDLWLTEKYKEQDKTPQKAASEKVLPSINPS